MDAILQQPTKALQALRLVASRDTNQALQNYPKALLNLVVVSRYVEQMVASYE